MRRQTLSVKRHTPNGHRMGILDTLNNRSSTGPLLPQRCSRSHRLMKILVLILTLLTLELEFVLRDLKQQRLLSPTSISSLFHRLIYPKVTSSSTSLQFYHSDFPCGTHLTRKPKDHSNPTSLSIQTCQRMLGQHVP
ncbi:hypothetical protein AVEN_41812-1 [Araneus ventricosus]|uniref:Uncharacterized protein n=1 Tax=Araneus ventricosus TaxID=182803 RepID=A0A4Y2AC69_ARAVE|nr:hypothetical protein AVEN_41812-1 [Araneus ventricosus]